MLTDRCTYRLLREPKGGPDAVLAGPAAAEGTLVRAGNTLSVMGYTARLILFEGTPDGLLNGTEAALLPVTVIMLPAEKEVCPPVTVLSENAEAGDLVRAAAKAIDRLRAGNGYPDK